MSNSSATSNANSETARWSELFHGRLGLYTVVLTLGTILFAVSNFVVIAIMPTAADEIGGSRLYAWVISLFFVGSVMGASRHPCTTCSNIRRSTSLSRNWPCRLTEKSSDRELGPPAPTGRTTGEFFNSLG